MSEELDRSAQHPSGAGARSDSEANSAPDPASALRHHESGTVEHSHGMTGGNSTHHAPSGSLGGRRPSLSSLGVLAVSKFYVDSAAAPLALTPPASPSRATSITLTADDSRSNFLPSSLSAQSLLSQSHQQQHHHHQHSHSTQFNGELHMRVF